jgi:hypothetical protein
VSAPADARTLNWRFVVPDEPPGLLYLPVDSEAPPGAVVAAPGGHGLAATLRGAPFPAVAVPDLGRWAPRRPAEARRILARLAAALAPGGWLCAGFANACFPGTPALTGALRLSSAERVLRRKGLSDLEVYLTLPAQRCPALLVPASRPVELDYVLRQLFLLYAPGEGDWAAARRQLLTLLGRGAMRVPHDLRMRFAPGFCVVARRPA